MHAVLCCLCACVHVCLCACVHGCMGAWVHACLTVLRGALRRETPATFLQEKVHDEQRWSRDGLQLHVLLCFCMRCVLCAWVHVGMCACVHPVFLLCAFIVHTLCVIVVLACLCGVLCSFGPTRPTGTRTARRSRPGAPPSPSSSSLGLALPGHRLTAAGRKALSYKHRQTQWSSARQGPR